MSTPKMKLSLEDLRVESFFTTPARGEATEVHGLQDSICDDGCSAYTNNGTDTTSDYTCLSSAVCPITFPNCPMGLTYKGR